METPHYTVTRLRHDDITADHLQTSYKLMEKPAVKTTALATQGIKAQKPLAAVQGITPNQPAPKHMVVKAPGMLSSFFAWLGSFGDEKPRKATTPATRSGNQPRRDRNEGNRQEGGQQGNRNRNKPRRDKEDTQKNEKQARPEGKSQEQQPRKEKLQQAQRPPRVNVEKPALENVVPAPRVEGEEATSNEVRKRGRRGGKRERERREQQNIEATGSNQVLVDNNSMAIAPVPVTFSDADQETGTQQAAIMTPVSEGLVQVETKPRAKTESAPQPSTTYQSRRRSRPREIYTIENKEPLIQIETHSAPIVIPAETTEAPMEK